MFLMNVADELLEQELISKYSRKVSATKTTLGSNMVPKAKKQTENITRHFIPHSCLFMHLSFVSFN